MFLSILTASFLVCGVLADNAVIAGYRTQNDVEEHAELDLDMQSLIDEANKSNFTGAFHWYSQGGNSIKNSGAIRTIQGFSKSSLTGEKWFDIFRSYWGDTFYADNFTSSACQGTGDFAESPELSISGVSRIEGCKKGAQYQNVWMYTIHEMEAAIADCKDNTIGTHWDEAVAFYAGSLVGAEGTDNGVMIYGLAEKRCGDFNTCDAADDEESYHESLVNEEIFELFSAGSEYSYTFSCDTMETTKEAIVQKMTVPLIQGVLKYLYLTDLQGSEKQRAELWAFAAALLPILDYYDPDAASTLRANSALTNTDLVPSGYAAVKASMESTYSSIGVTCADVGGYASSTSSTGYYPGMEPCSDSSTTGAKSDDDDSSSMPVYGIVLLVILLVFFVSACVVGGFYYGKSTNSHTKLNETEGMVGSRATGNALATTADDNI